MTPRMTDNQIDHYARILDGMTHLSIEASRELLTEARRARKAEDELSSENVAGLKANMTAYANRVKELEAQLTARPEPAPMPKTTGEWYSLAFDVLEDPDIRPDRGSTEGMRGAIAAAANVTLGAEVVPSVSSESMRVVDLRNENERLQKIAERMDDQQQRYEEWLCNDGPEGHAKLVAELEPLRRVAEAARHCMGELTERFGGSEDLEGGPLDTATRAVFEALAALDAKPADEKPPLAAVPPKPVCSQHEVELLPGAEAPKRAGPSGVDEPFALPRSGYNLLRPDAANALESAIRDIHKRLEVLELHPWIKNEGK